MKEKQKVHDHFFQVSQKDKMRKKKKLLYTLWKAVTFTCHFFLIHTQKKKSLDRIMGTSTPNSNRTKECCSNTKLLCEIVFIVFNLNYLFIWLQLNTQNVFVHPSCVWPVHVRLEL